MSYKQTSTHRYGKGSYHQIGLVRGQFGNVPMDQWLQFLKELDPRIARVGVLFNPRSAPRGGRYFLEPIENAVEQVEHDVPPPLRTRPGPRASSCLVLRLGDRPRRGQDCGGLKPEAW